MRVDKILTTGVLLLLVNSAVAIDFTRVNISWQYDPFAEIVLRSRVVQNGDSMTIFIRFHYSVESEWLMQYLVQPKYESESQSELNPFALDTLVSSSGKIIVKLTFKKPEENLLVVKVFKEDAFYYYDIPLKNGYLPYPNIFPIDQDGLPIFENYLNTSNFSWSGGNAFYTMRYVENFSLADPPMGEMKPLAPSTLPDSSFQFSNNMHLTDNYFYVFRQDSNALSSVTVLKTSPYYPELKLLNELSSSLQYILNEPEKKGLKNSKNLKESFDSFWMKTYVTKFRARNAIRNYFNWVEQANKLFTDFKQGWKTDRGMIYIVYGLPDEVYRTDGEEEWYYDDGPAFEFTVIPTYFSPRTYGLRRRVEFEESWFEFIAAIRRGTND